MKDTALEEFLKQFGDTDPNKSMVQNQRSSIPKNLLGLQEQEMNYNGLANQISDPKLRPKNLKSLVSEIKPTGLQGTDIGTKDIDTNLLKKDSIESPSFIDKAKDVGGKVLDAAPAAMGLISNMKGEQFDTSADSGGPGKAGGAIMQGAATGIQLANSVGLKDPLSQGLFALGGGLISTFAQTKAMKEWRKNQVKQNRSENALEKKTREEEYSRSEGLMSMDALKGLRQKQLGILNM